MLLKGKTLEDINLENDLKNYNDEIRKLEDYLKETDWYVTRQAEAPHKKIPDDVKTLREEARERISLIRDHLI